jgi:hypothetical protein
MSMDSYGVLVAANRAVALFAVDVTYTDIGAVYRYWLWLEGARVQDIKARDLHTQHLRA